jgi:hypothetical protein
MALVQTPEVEIILERGGSRARLTARTERAPPAGATLEFAFVEDGRTVLLRGAIVLQRVNEERGWSGGWDGDFVAEPGLEFVYRWVTQD